MRISDEGGSGNYSYDADGRLLLNGEPVANGHRRPASTPPRNPDGSKATARDTEAFARSLVGLTVGEAERQAQDVPHITVVFSGTDVYTTDWQPFRVSALVREGRIGSVAVG